MLEIDEATMEIINQVINTMAASFRFGFYDLDDIKQEARQEAIKAIRDKYDCKRPLKNFLYVHLRRRLLNLRRDKFSRKEPPCLKCPEFDKHYKETDNQCKAFLNKMHCQPFEVYTIRNTAKENIVKPVDIDAISETERNICKHYQMEDGIESREIFDKLDQEMPLDMRPDYLKLKGGLKLPKSKRDKVMAKIREILNVQIEES